LAEFVELEIEAGATFSTEITLSEEDGTGKNLANLVISSQVRKSYYSSSATSFNISIADQANGIFLMEMSAANTANLRAGRYVFDVEIQNTQDGTVTRIFEGIATVLPNVTR
jgi:hypothetical protein